MAEKEREGGGGKYIFRFSAYKNSKMITSHIYLIYTFEIVDGSTFQPQLYPPLACFYRSHLRYKVSGDFLRCNCWKKNSVKTLEIKEIEWH